ncbi:IS66 family transposase [Synoicihabitans lomoniglobus]|uniref:IS66 family transposase n=1 Tax=Synoicihabitans lomoniglobus TaxID=2909285 RepID=A0AAF0I2J7_9BACT|nr:IS66 family transposase [Opitutaceae bacterium LMO-M01]
MPPAEVLYAENQALKAELAQRDALIGWLQKQVFGGGKSEKLDPSQLKLKLLDQQKLIEQTATPETISYERRRASRERVPLRAEAFAHLPVKETVVIEPEEVLAAPNQFERIGEQRSFEVDVVPPKLFKREFVLPKYRAKNQADRAPVVAPAQVRPVEGGYASAGLLAWVLISKYLDHAPLYRLEKMSGRWGARLPRQSMVEWVRIASDWLEPIYTRMHRGLLESGYVQVDETPVRCHDPDQKRGKTKDGWLWVMNRPGGDVVFDWRLSRQHGELTSLVEGFAGVLQSDGYGAYAAYAAAHPEVRWVGCWAHARRKFFEAQGENPRVAQWILRSIAWMYHQEKHWDETGLDTSQRQQRRERDFTRRLYWLRVVVARVREQVLPQSGLGKACAYLLGQWAPLCEHLRHGETRLDNNLVENAIRPSALGKKNWLFVGHPDAGQRSAIIYSLVISCQRHGHDPLIYLRDVLTRLPQRQPGADITDLLPANWKPPVEVERPTSSQS